MHNKRSLNKEILNLGGFTLFRKVYLAPGSGQARIFNLRSAKMHFRVAKVLMTTFKKNKLITLSDL